MATATRPKFLFLISLILAWFFDFLFWDKQWGISFPLFVFALVAVGFWLARTKGLAPSRRSLWLLIPIAFLALVSVFRAEPDTLFFSRAMVIFLLWLLALTFLGGRWLEYSFSDFVSKLVGLIPSGLMLLASLTAPKAGRQSSSRRTGARVLLGLALSLPLLFFFGSLLSSADPVFGNWLSSFLNFLDFQNVGEYIFRFFYIVILALLFSAVYLYMLFRSRKESLIGVDQPVIKPMLGFVESATILVSVNLLFAAFVIFQFGYFFGGASYITAGASGLTYAEYARQGFGQLVFVALTSLLFYIAMSSVTTRRDSQQKWFSGLGITLFALVAVILASSFQRLFLYEDAYGFTRIRTASHTFMIWVGILLLAVVVLESLRRQRAFAIAVLFTALGFVASLALLNIDSFIVHANIHRVALGYQLDVPYLASLSDDAVPALVDEYHQAVSDGRDYADQIAMALACHAELNQGYQVPLAWQSWSLSAGEARAAIGRVHQDPAFPSFRVFNEDLNGIFLLLNGISQPCQDAFSD